jgi:hypothetical protein
VGDRCGKATIDTNGDATYDFITPAAFDGLILDDAHLMKTRAMMLR